MGGGLLVLDVGEGGTGREEKQGATAAMAHGTAQWFHCAQQEEAPFAKTPSTTFRVIPNRSSSTFRDLIETPNHFLKFCKNSSGFQLTCRAYPKIGVAI